MADRRRLGARDMVLTMAVVLVVVGLIAFYGGGISFAPGGPGHSGPTPTAQVVDGFERAATTLQFPVTVPRGLPSAWHPNSFSLSDPDAHRDGMLGIGSLPAVRGGWVTPGGTYIELVESSGSPDQLLANEFGGSRSPTGTVRAGGAEWQVTTGVRDEPAWIRTDGATTLLITGDASRADFVTLAAAVAG